MKTTVIIQIDVEGFHYYKDAPNEVNYLRNNHRHTFKIKAGYLVNDLDREKEIFICRDQVISYLKGIYGIPCNFEMMSCEMIAKKILEYGNEYGMVWVEVWEEETGGARVEI